jgi:Tol biopolymer transport system component
MLNRWNSQSGRLQQSFLQKGTSYSRWGLALSHDGKRLAYTCDGQTKKERVGIYDAHKGSRLRLLPSQSFSGALCFLPRSHTLFLGLNGRFEVWDVDSGTLVRRGSWNENDAIASSFQSPSPSPDGRSLAVIRSETQNAEAHANGRRDEIGLFSTRTWKLRRVFSWPNTSIETMGFVDGGRSLVVRTTTWRWAKAKSGHNSMYPVSRVLLLDPKSRRQRVVKQLPEWRSRDLAISPDGRLFALADSFSVLRSIGPGMVTADRETTFIEIREARTGRKQASLRLPGESHLKAMTFAADSATLYFSTGQVGRWEKKNWKVGAALSSKEGGDSR